jgi:hypothetical protein
LSKLAPKDIQNISMPRKDSISSNQTKGGQAQAKPQQTSGKKPAVPDPKKK